MTSINKKNNPPKTKTGSLLIAALSSFSVKLGKLFKESFFFGLLTRCSNRSRLSELTGKINYKRKISVPFKRFVSEETENGIIVRTLRSRITSLLNLQVKCIGTFIFFFGFFIVISSLIGFFSVVNDMVNYYDVGVGVILSLIGVIAIPSQKKISDALLESRIVSFILFDVLGIKRSKIGLSGQPYGKNGIAAIIGILFGILSFFTSVSAMILLIPMLAVAYTVLVMPESGVIMLILSFPFLGTEPLAALCLAVNVCYLLKLFRGKRTFSVTAVETLFILLATVVFFAGLISVGNDGGLRLALEYITFMTTYFSALNLIKNHKWADRCMRAAIFSLTVIVLSCFIPFVFDMLGLGAVNEFISYMVRPFPAAALSSVITLLLPVLVCYTMTSENGDHKFGLSVIAVTAAAVSVMYGTRGGVIAMLAAVLLYLFIAEKKAFAVTVTAALCIPALFACLPDNIMNVISEYFAVSDISLAVRQTVSDFTLGVLGRSPLGGIGIVNFDTGTVSESVFYSYANSMAYILVSTGITGFTVFAAWLLSFIGRGAVRISKISKYIRRNSISVACYCGVCGFFLESFFDNTFSSPRSFMAVWLFAGFACAFIAQSDDHGITVYDDMFYDCSDQKY